jgi:3-oxoacyl-[acyl-carrier-protein] synthase-3
MSASAPAPAPPVTPVTPQTVAGARFLGLGRALPDTVVTNADLEARLDTSDTWIRERTGIVERRVADPGQTTADLAVTAGAEALRGSGVDPADVDVVIVATTTPDIACPATAAAVQAELGTAGAAFDLNAACAGFAYALYVGIGMLAAGSVDHVLVIGADRFTALVDPDDRATAILFGDGAGALLLGSTGPDFGNGPGLLGADLGGDGNALTALYVPPGEAYVSMDGQEVFRRATRALVTSCSSALDAAGAKGPDDVDLFVPHQANARIIDATARRLHIPPERVVIDVDRYGNTSAASVPIALAEADDDGRLKDGSRVLLAGIGAGMAWASLYVRWGT